MERTLAPLFVVALCGCGLAGETGAGEGEGEGSVGEEGEGEGVVDDDALFFGLTAALYAAGPDDRDLVVVVGGSAEAEASVVAVATGSDFRAASVAGGVAVFEDAVAVGVASARVVFRDDVGHQSAATDVAITARVVRDAGDACDAAVIVDRCADGLGCKGTPATCQAAEAPRITRVSYQPGEDGPRLLVKGVDLDNDVGEFDLAFKDAAGEDVFVDLDGDDVVDAAGFTVGDARASRAGGFFVDVAMGLSFDLAVAAIDVVVRDRSGLASAPSRAALLPVPVRPAGAGCDLDGFDACVAGASCVPLGTAALCRTESSARDDVCAGATAINVDDGGDVSGVIPGGEGVFDTAEGCAAGAPRQRPEAVVVVEVTRTHGALTFSTDTDGTGVDTVVSVFDACGAAVPVACADDGDDTLAASVVVEDVAAGTYTVVVESWSGDGGPFELAITPGP